MYPIPTKKVHEICSARKRGMSLPEIASKFNIAKSSAWRLTHHLKLPEKVKKEIRSRQGGNHIRAHHRRKLASETAHALIKVGYSSKCDPLILAALYWAEGSKGGCVFTNADAHMIAFFIKTLRKDFGITNDRLRIMVRIGTHKNQKQILKHWSRATGIPISHIRLNVDIKNNSSSTDFGICRVTIAQGAQLLKVLKALQVQLTEAIL